jgi:hypothetical protein
MRTGVLFLGIVAAIFFVVAAVLTLSDVSDRDLARFVLFGLASATFAWTLAQLDRH